MKRVNKKYIRFSVFRYLQNSDVAIAMNIGILYMSEKNKKNLILDLKEKGLKKILYKKKFYSFNTFFFKLKPPE